MENTFKKKQNKNCKLVDSTYKKDDCIFLLKDLTKDMPDTSLEEKERMIANGVNYSEMISKESYMDNEVNQQFKDILHRTKDRIALCTITVAEKILQDYGKNIVLVSLARAGTPVGILIKRYINTYKNINVKHYSISVIREVGIDENALLTILKENPNKKPIFIDGWTGKGSIYNELEKTLNEFNMKHNLIGSKKIENVFAVLADPAHIANIYGTRKDICIANSCLNSTVSGLVSRTIFNRNYINEKDYHGAKYYKDLKNQDFSNYFIDTVCKQIEKYKDSKIEHYSKSNKKIPMEEPDRDYSKKVVEELKKQKGEHVEWNKVKLSIGETTRAILRRSPKVIYVQDINNPDLDFIKLMAKKRDVEIIEGLDKRFGYECIGILN